MASQINVRDETITNFLSINAPMNIESVNLPEAQQNVLDLIYEKLNAYYTPSVEIMPYLILMFFDFGHVKEHFPLEPQPEYYYDNVLDKNSLELEHIDGTFGLKSQRNYILHVAYQEDYNNFYTENDKQELKNFLEDAFDKHDVVRKVEVLRGANFKKSSEFPFYELVYAMGLFNFDENENYYE
jgi:hypothetical protein